MWQRFFIPNTTPETVLTHFRDTLIADGFKTYDPFAGGTGSPVGVKTRLRLFIAPAESTWVKVLMSPEDQLESAYLSQIAAHIPILHLTVSDDKTWGIHLYEGTTVSSNPTALTPYLKPDSSPDDLKNAWEGTLSTQEKAVATDLPHDVEAYARQQGVNPQIANSMFKRMSKRVNKKLEKQGGSDPNAQAALAGNPTVNWQSEAGRRLSAVVHCLTVPTTWRTPEWQPLTDAYQIARQKARGGLLLAGEDKILQNFQGVLDYTLLYAAKKGEIAT